MIVADTSALLAYFNEREPAHEAVSEVFDSADDAIILSPYVVEELDYLVATRVGVAVELSVLKELTKGPWEHPPFGAADITQASRIIEKYRDLNVGIADASLVVLASRYRTDQIATLDDRHFSVLRPLGGRRRFQLLPERA